MTAVNEKDELISYLKKMETFDKDSAQDASILHAYLLDLTNMGARANFLRVEYQKALRIAKKTAYLNLMASSHATEKYFAPSLAKDYVDSCCSEQAEMAELAERTAAQAVHTMDALRTIISSLKSERQFAGIS